MILLDPDHLSILKYPESPGYGPLVARMEESGENVFATTIVSVEEQMRGWLALIHKTTDIDRHVALYEQLTLLFDLFRRWTVVPFDHHSAEEHQLSGCPCSIPTSAKSLKRQHRTGNPA